MLPRGTWRRPRSLETDRRSQIPHMPPMAEPPPRWPPAPYTRHREGDLLKGARKGSTVGTLVEGLAVLVFFADPYSPWQRGSNDTTTGLLRPDLSKGDDISRYTQREVNAIPIA